MLTLAIYKLNYAFCFKNYIDQTGRRFRVQYKEDISTIRDLTYDDHLINQNRSFSTTDSDLKEIHSALLDKILNV